MPSSLKFSYPPKPIEISEDWLDISKDEFSLEPDSDFTLLSNSRKINSIPSLPAIPIPQNDNKNFDNSKKTKNRILSNSHSSDYTSKKIRTKKKSYSGANSQIKKNRIDNLRINTTVATRNGAENSDNSYRGSISKPDSKFNSPDYNINFVPVQKNKYDSLDEQLQDSFKYLEPNNVHSGIQKDLSNENNIDRTFNDTKEKNMDSKYYEMSGVSKLAEMELISPQITYIETKIKSKKSQKLEKPKKISQATENTNGNSNDEIKEIGDFSNLNMDKIYSDNNSHLQIDKLYNCEDVRAIGEEEKINSSFESITLKSDSENVTNDKDKNKDAINIKENALTFDDVNLLEYKVGCSSKVFPEESNYIETEAENKISSLTTGANKTECAGEKHLYNTIQSEDESVSTCESISAHKQSQIEIRESANDCENDEFSNKSQIAINPSRKDLLNSDQNDDNNNNIFTGSKEEPVSCPTIEHILEDDKTKPKNEQYAIYKPSSDCDRVSEAYVTENNSLESFDLNEVEENESGSEIADGHLNSTIETGEYINSAIHQSLTLDDISNENFKNEGMRSTRSSARVAAASAAANKGIEKAVFELDYQPKVSSTNFSNDNTNTATNNNRKHAIYSTLDSNFEIEDITTSKNNCKSKKGSVKKELSCISSKASNEGFADKLAEEVAEISGGKEILCKSDTSQSVKDTKEIKEDKDKNSSISNSIQKKSPKSKSKKKKSGRR
ncbi:hypothetical protein AYI69_g10581 [Smittium culicis]|uniref:Uncharacterized protein n=1 Tax=Smittium culicis TaxID=133412 RepID=A0A1R1X4Q5_9FUNG|nr:hypothetical protein AYI69_g10581 [Smittium culicis]